MAFQIKTTNIFIHIDQEQNIIYSIKLDKAAIARHIVYIHYPKLIKIEFLIVWKSLIVVLIMKNMLRK